MTPYKKISKIKVFSLIFLPLVTLFLIVAGGMAYQKKNADLQKTALKETSLVQFEKGLFENSLAGYMADAMTLAHFTESELADPAAARQIHPHLGQFFLSYIRNHHQYDHIRFMDASGMEKVRVDRNRLNQVSITPAQELENKSRRPYFTRAVHRQSQIYVSAFDLNVEKEKIERPFKPILRLLCPVNGPDDEILGFVAINILGRKLLGDLRASEFNSKGVIYLVNDKGQWLKGPSPDSEWLFMFGKETSASMAADHPEAWQMMKGKPQGQFKIREGLFSFACVDAALLAPGGKTSFKGISAQERWKIISYIPAGHLVPEWQQGFIQVLAGAVLAIGLFSWAGTLLYLNRRKVLWQLKHTERQVSVIARSALDAIIMADDTGAVIFWNTAAEQMFGYTEQEVTGRPVHDLIAPEAVRKKAEAGLASFHSTGRGRLVGGKVELDALRKDGSRFSAELTLNATTMEGRTCTIGVVRDITDWKTAQAKILALNETLETRVAERTAALKESQERISLLLESTSEGIFGVDTQGRLTFINRAAVEMLGLSREEALGGEVQQMIIPDHPKGRPEAGCPVLRAPVQGASGGMNDGHMLRRDGTRFPAEYSAVPMRRDDGEQVGTVIIFRDITDRRREEETLKEERRLLKAILDISPIAVAFSADGVIRYGNPALEEQFNVTTGQKVIDNYVNPEDRDEIVAAMQLEGRVTNRTVKMYDGNGHELDMLISFLPATYGGQRGILGWLVDITEQKRTQEELKKQQAQLRGIIDHIPSVVILKDRHGRHLVINSYFEQATGFGPDQVLGKTDAEFFDAKTADAILEKDSEVIKSGRTFTFEESVPHPDGSQHDYLTSKVPLTDDGGEVYALAVIATDITERKRMETAIAEEREQLQTILNVSPMGVAVSTRNIIRFTNAKVKELFDVKDGDPAPEFYRDPEDRRILLERMAKDGRVENHELQLYGRDRQLRDILMNIMPIKYQGEDGILAMWMDITDRKKIERALANEREQLQTILDISPLGVAFSIDGVFRFANPKFLEMVDGRIGEPAEHIYVDPQEREEVIRRLKKDGHVDNCEIQMYTPDREIRDIFVNFMPIHLFGREGVLGWLLDITERKQSEKKLRDRQRSVALEAEVGLILTRPIKCFDEVLKRCTDSLVTHLDAAFARIWTLNHEEQMLELRASAGIYTHLDGTHSRVPVGGFKIGLIASEQKPHLTNHVLDDPRVSDKQWAKREGMVSFAGYPLIVENRVEGVMAMFARRPLDQSTLETLGNLARVLALFIMRYQAEKNLQISESKFRTLYEATDDAVMLRDKEKFIDCNSAALKIFACTTAEEFKTLHPADLSPQFQPDGQSSLKTADRHMAEAFKKGSHRFQWIHRRLDGTRFPADVLINVIELHGQPVLEAVVRDITQLKQAEEEMKRAKDLAEEATRAKSSFLAQMSHEIRTPMNAILGMTDLAMKTDLTAKQKDYISKANTSAQNLLGIINDILDFSKIEAGKLHIESVDFNLDEVLENLANILGIRAEKKGVELIFNISRDVPIQLVGDPLRLGQILLNLGNNAIKFTPQGEVVVSIELLDETSAGAVLKFSVKDSGVGMSEKEMAKIFSPFQQADTSTTRIYGGTGLGLTICQSLVKSMEGEIRVESRQDRGSIFSFTVKLQRQTDEVRKYHLPDARLKKMCILVADSSTATREAIENILAYFHFEIRPANSPEEVLQLLGNGEDHPYGLVILDHSSLGDNGIELGKQLKLNSKSARLPVIVIGARSAKGIHSQAKEAGLDAVLYKPVLPSVFFQTLLKTLGYALENHKEYGNQNDRASLEKIRGARILLVDDNEINQQVARENLEREGLRVTTADNGEQAVKRVQKARYDLVLMDIQMPVMDGYEATRKIRELKDEEKSKIPVIAMSAHAMAEHQKMSIEAGMNDHLPKPIEPDKLFALLSRWIKPAKRTGQETRTGMDKDEPVEKVFLPDALQGIDIESGLRRVAGNKNLYRELLFKFKNQYAAAAHELKRRVINEDFQGAEQLAHSLKGLSGNLGAQNLYQALARLEKELGEAGINRPGPLIDEVAACLNEVTGGIDSLENKGSSRGGEAPPAGVEPVDLETVAPLLTEMTDLLNTDFNEAMKRLEEIRPHLTHSVVAGKFNALEACVDNFDSPGASDVLKQITAALNLIS